MTSPAKTQAANLTATAPGAPGTVGGRRWTGRRALEFTSDRPSQYTAQLSTGADRVPGTVGRRFDHRRYDSLGETSGTIPANEAGEFSEFVREGTLPAGAHRFHDRIHRFRG